MANTYRNKLTGVTVTVDAEVGGDWVLVSTQSSLPKQETKTEEKPEKEKKPAKKAKEDKVKKVLKRR